MTDSPQSKLPPRHPQDPSPLGRDLHILQDRLSEGGFDTAPDIDSALSAPLTGLPSLQRVLHDLALQLRERGWVAILTVHVNPAMTLQQVTDWASFDTLVQAIGELLQQIRRDHMRRGDSLAEVSMTGNTFVLVLSPPRGGEPPDYSALSALRSRLRQRLTDLMAQQFPDELARQYDGVLGCALITHDGTTEIRRAVLAGLESAYADALSERDRDLRARRTQLEQIVEKRSVSMVFQPIVDLASRRVIGYEALARCPEFGDTGRMFATAAECGLERPLEQLCQETAMAALPAMPRDTRLFLNVGADWLLGASASDLARLAPLAGRGVIELTERTAVSNDQLFGRALAALARHGLEVAIDDLGSAYSGLRVVAEARPAFLKIDMGITRGIEHDEIREELVRFLGKFAKRSGAALVVEGVESAAELRASRRVGVSCFQGYYLGVPAPQFVAPDLDRLAADLEHESERDVLRRLDALKAELGDIEREVLATQASPHVLEDFKLALDHMRTSVWAVFTNADPQAQGRVLSHFRLKRVKSMFRDVLEDLRVGTITGSSPDFEELRDLLEQLQP